MQILNYVEIVVGILLIAFALIIVFSNKVINSVIFLSLLSMISVVAFALYKAPDVAITEAVIGSGLITFIFIITIKSVKKAGDHK